VPEAKIFADDLNARFGAHAYGADDGLDRFKG
jgi:hypothetical protein